MASGNSTKSISYLYRLGLSTVSVILKTTCNAIWETLKYEYLPVPTKINWEQIAENFENKWNFPNCVGAIDGKHTYQNTVVQYVIYTTI